MASDVDICNLALAHLGDSATVVSIDPPEGSAQAEHCARFYPIARDTLLESHQWGFNTRRAALAMLTTEHPAWDYCYAVPDNAMSVFAVISKDAGNDYSEAPLATSVLPIVTGGSYPTQPFALETLADGTEVVLTDLADAWARYTVRITDAGRFTPLFVDCLSWLLASYLAGPVLKGDTGAAAGKTAFQVYLQRLAGATESDANDRNVKPMHNVAWMAGR